MKRFFLMLVMLSGLVCSVCWYGARAQQTVFVPVCIGDATLDTAKFNQFKSIIGSTVTGTIRLPYKGNSAQRCKLNSFSTGANITIDNSDGGGIFVVSGQTLTLGPIHNPPGKQMFYNALAGQGTVTFSIAPPYVQPEMWGTANGALAAAIAASSSIVLSAATYTPDTNLVLARGTTLRGIAGDVPFSTRQSLIRPTAAVTVAISVNSFAIIDGIDLDGVNTNGGVGIKIGADTSNGAVSIKNSMVQNFKGTDGAGIWIAQALNCVVDNVMLDQNHRNLLVDGIVDGAGTAYPDAVTISNSRIERAQRQGVLIRTGFSISFINQTIIESSAEEGVLIQTTVDDVTDVRFDHSYFEDNWHLNGSQSSQHSLVVDTSGGIRTARMSITNSFFHDGAEKSIKLVGNGTVGGLIDNVQVANSSGSISVGAGTNVTIANFPANLLGSYSTIVTGSGTVFLTTTKAYVDAGLATKLNLSGGTLTGPLTVNPGVIGALNIRGRDNLGTDESLITFYKFDGSTVEGSILAQSGTLALRDSTGTQVVTITPGAVALAGIPTAPTAAVDANTTQIATTAYVVGQGYLKSATAASTYLPLSGGTLTGGLTLAFDNISKLNIRGRNNGGTDESLTTFYKFDGTTVEGSILAQSGLLALRDSTGANMVTVTPGAVTLGGTPAAPTAAVDTNTTQVATTAYVIGQLYLKSATAASTYLPLSGGTISGLLNVASNYKNNGVLMVSATAPTISGFGTSPSVTASNGSFAFDINVGTGGSASTGTITFSPAAATGWVVMCADVTTPASFRTDQTGGSTTNATVTNYSRTTGLAIAWTASDHLRCIAHPY